jgi:2-polyprenyl-3-methyl-5-hydroxy-6-metoxy-1,4-benzoquinol methylase
LLWLASRGFRTISGTDIDNTALNLCRALQKEMGLSFPVLQDDGMQPKYPTRQQDVILSVNWLYHIPHASLDAFLENYLPSLKNNGVIICDIIDSAYNKVKNNSFHSEDAKKPQHERRPSEYTFRMSHLEVAETAKKYGLHIMRQAGVYAIPQRRVYMLSRKDGIARCIAPRGSQDG